MPDTVQCSCRITCWTRLCDNDLENWGRPQFLVIHAAVILGSPFLVSRIFELSLNNLDGFHTRKSRTELDLAEKGTVLLNSEGFSAIN